MHGLPAVLLDEGLAGTDKLLRNEGMSYACTYQDAHYTHDRTYGRRIDADQGIDSRTNTWALSVTYQGTDSHDHLRSG